MGKANHCLLSCNPHLCRRKTVASAHPVHRDPRLCPQKPRAACTRRRHQPDGAWDLPARRSVASPRPCPAGAQRTPRDVRPGAPRGAALACRAARGAEPAADGLCSRRGAGARAAAIAAGRGGARCVHEPGRRRVSGPLEWASRGEPEHTDAPGSQEASIASEGGLGGQGRHGRDAGAQLKVGANPNDLCRTCGSRSSRRSTPLRPPRSRSRSRLWTWQLRNERRPDASEWPRPGQGRSRRFVGPGPAGPAVRAATTCCLQQPNSRDAHRLRAATEPPLQPPRPRMAHQENLGGFPHREQITYQVSATVSACGIVSIAVAATCEHIFHRFVYIRISRRRSWLAHTHAPLTQPSFTTTSPLLPTHNIIKWSPCLPQTPPTPRLQTCASTGT
jgi:hypothetical protein